MDRRETAPFLEAILETPDDDAPRLVFADFLEENGQADRAALIRLQIEQYRLPDSDVRKRLLGYRVAALLERHQHDWKRELPEMPDVQWLGFERGFVHAALIRDRSVLTEHAEELRSATPIHTITLSVDGESEEWDQYESLEWLRRLTIWSDDYLVIDDMDAFAECPLLEHLQYLNLTGMSLENNGIRAFLDRTPFLRHLTDLTLDHNFIGVSGVEAFGNHRYLSGLKRLSLDGQGYGSYSEDPVLKAEGLAALASIPHFTHLETLQVAGNQIDANGFAHILRSRHLQNLHTLRLHENEIDAKGLAQLRGVDGSVRIRSLDVSTNRIGDRGITALTEIPALRDLQHLDLSVCEIGAAGVRSLTSAAFWPQLRTLRLSNNRLGPDGAFAIAKAAASSIEELGLTNCELGAEGAKHLADAPCLSTVIELRLTKNQLETEGVCALVTSPHLAQVRILELEHNKLGDEVLNALTRSPCGTHLHQLGLGQNDITGESFAAFRFAEWPELSRLSLSGNRLEAKHYGEFFKARWPNLQHLNLASTGATKEVIAALLASHVAARLVDLNIANNPELGDEAGRLLSKCEALQGLRTLDIGQVKMTDKGIRAILGSPFLQSLAYLQYWGNRFEPTTRERLTDRFPYSEDQIPF